MNKSDGITIKDFLAIEELEHSKIIAGTSGVLQSISKINIVADYDIFNWVEDGEFLLTTGYFFTYGDSVPQVEFIQQCINSGLSGLGIKIRPYLPSLDEKAIELADQHNFPIIDIDSQIPLSSIINIFTKYLLDKRTALLERIEVLNREMNQIMMTSGKIEDVLKILESQIQNPISLHISFNNNDYYKFNYLDNFSETSIKENYLTFLNSHNKFSNDDSLVESKIIIEDKLVTRYIMPIINKSNVIGHLFSWSTHTPLQEFDAVVMETGSIFISLILLQELSKQEVELKYRTRYIDDLISENIEQREQAVQRAYLYEMGEDDYYISIVLDFTNTTETVDDSQQDSTFIYQNILSIENYLQKYLLHGLTTSESSSLRIIINSPNLENFMTKVEAFSKELLHSLQQKFIQYSFQFGIGKVVKGITNLKTSYQSAFDALTIGYQIMDDPIVTYDQLGIYTVLANDAVRSQVNEIFDHHIKALIDYDKNKNSELVNTLNCYFKNNSNVAKVSEEMFTHYNTTLYRLNRIQKITNLDINNPDDKFLLEVALKIAKLQQH